MPGLFFLYMCTKMCTSVLSVSVSIFVTIFLYMLAQNNQTLATVWRRSTAMTQLYRDRRSRCGHYIFVLWFLLSFFFFFPSPNLSGRRVDVYHTSTHGVALVRIQNAGLKCAARGSLKIQDAKNRQKFAIWAPSHKFVGLYLRK